MGSSRSARSAAASGVVVCVALAGLALADQLWFGWTRRDVAAHYGRYGLHPNPDVLTVVLMVVFLAGAAGFGLITRSAGRGRRAMAWGLAVAGVVAGVTVACVTSFAAEYGAHVLTIGWRLAPWLMPVLCCWVCGQLLTTRRSQSRLADR